MAHVQKQVITIKRTGKQETRWQGRWIAPDGRVRTKRFARKAEAEAWVKQQELSHLTRSWVDPNRGKKRFSEWVEEWQAIAPQGRPSTQARTAITLRCHLLPAFDSTALRDIDKPRVRRYAAELSAKGQAPETVRKTIYLLTKILQGAVDDGLIFANPAQGIELPKIERAPVRFLTPPELSHLVACTPEAYGALILTAGWGGLRMGDCSR